MPGFNVAMANEIKRVARKDLKPELSATRALANAQRHEIAALKRRVKDLESVVSKLLKANRRTPDAPTVSAEKQVRWSPSGFAKMRKRKGLSAQQMGALIGASAPTIYKMEKDESGRRPGAQAIAAILAVRKMSKREIEERLAELA